MVAPLIPCLSLWPIIFEYLSNSEHDFHKKYEEMTNKTREITKPKLYIQIVCVCSTYFAIYITKMFLFKKTREYYCRPN